jgi:hypothetical protein
MLSIDRRSSLSAIEKTKELLRLDLPLSLFVKNERNPNKMSARDFDLLVDNIEQTGLTDPILVRPASYSQVATLVMGAGGHARAVEKEAIAMGLKFKIVGGHHRYDAAAYLGFETAPATVIMDPKFDEKKETFQLVRMNTIHGKIDPAAFFKIYSDLQEDYTDEVLQEAFGFSDEAEWKRLINQTAKALPNKDLQQKFKEAAAEIKTIDGLSKLLNEMFTRYGDTVPFGYMIVDFGGQKSVWLRVSKKTMDAVDAIGTICMDRQRTMDDLFGGVVKLIASGDLKEQLEAIVAATPEVKLPKNLMVSPTKDHLEQAGAL